MSRDKQRSWWMLLTLLLVSCNRSPPTVEPSPVPTWTPTVGIVAQATEIIREITVVVTATPTVTPVIPTPEPTTTPTATTESTSTPTELPPTPTVVSPRAESSMNLRAGPGTNYPVVGSLSAGESVQIVSRNETGDWYKVTTAAGTEAWAAAWLLTSAPDPTLVVLATDIPTPVPTATLAPVVSQPTQVVSANPAPAPAPQQPVDLTPQLNVTQSCGHFEYRVYNLRRVKSVWLYDREYIAQGNFLLVFVEVKNISSGTSYFGGFSPRLAVWANDDLVYMKGDSRASSYAGWMYQTGGFYEDVNPGQVIGLVEAYPLPVDRELPLFFVTYACVTAEIDPGDVMLILGWWSKVPQGHDTPQ